MAFVVALGLGITIARSNTIAYTYSGAQGFGAEIGPTLAGGFYLDTDATRYMTPLPNGENGSSSVFTSPNQQLWGTFGLWSFTGEAGVYVMDGPPLWSSGQDNTSSDYWIVRTPVTGAMVNNLTPTFLNLFYYTSPGGMNDSALLPPGNPLSSPNEYDFQFALSLADAEGASQTVFGRLFSIQSVPEPSVASLFLVGAMLLAASQRWKRTHRTGVASGNSGQAAEVVAKNQYDTAA